MDQSLLAWVVSQLGGNVRSGRRGRIYKRGGGSNLVGSEQGEVLDVGKLTSEKRFVWLSFLLYVGIRLFGRNKRSNRMNGVGGVVCIL